MESVSRGSTKLGANRERKPESRREAFVSYMKRYYGLYLLLIPGIIFILIFSYAPMYGITLAFKDYNLFNGSSPLNSVFSSPWVGLENFRELFRDPYFYKVLGNTLIISVYKIVFLFPIPIIIAILLNEVGHTLYKRSLQTVLYLPHFISWTVVGGLFLTLLGSTGIVNSILKGFGIHQVNFLMSNSLFRGVLVFSSGWKEVGWSTIIFLAAITGIDMEQYEAAKVDGANKLRQIWNITIPGIATTIVLMLLLKIAYIMDAGFEQIFVMYNPMVFDSSDIIGTYVYRTGLGQLNFSYGTAVGLFNSVVGFVLLVSCNKLCRKYLKMGIW